MIAIGRVVLASVMVLCWTIVASPGAFALPAGVELLKAQGGDGTKRRALVIGNADYRQVPKLRNSEADANAVARLAQRLGFDTLLARNLDRRGMNETVNDFLQTIEGGTEVVIYFAGHGVEVQGSNYLLPTDIPALNPEQERLLRTEGINLTQLMQDVESRSARMALVILDACRENPFPKVGTRSVGNTRGGLGRVDPPQGSFVIFAAGAGELAIDNLGPQDRDPNGLFTRRLLTLMNEEGLELRSLVRRLRDDVSEAAQALAGRSQVPSYYDGMRGEFYFRRPRAGAETAQTACDKAVDPVADRTAIRKADQDEAVRACTVAVESHPNEPRFRRLLQAAQDQRAYSRAVDSKDRGLSVAYLDFFPNGRFIEDVKQHLAALAPVPAPAPAPAPAVVAPVPAPAPGPVARAWAGKDCPQCPDMVSIPLGSFVMGVPAGEVERERVDVQERDEESPQRAVTISNRFSMGRYEVTRGQYAAFVAATGRANASCKGFDSAGKLTDRANLSWLNPGFPQTDSDPVVCVSWEDATAYAEWLSRTTGKTYRLPSEAEWEYAARAGTGTARYWGDGRNDACRFGNVADRTLVQRLNRKSDPEFNFECTDNFAYTAPVGKFQPNRFGLYDMLGNADEWVEDCWKENYLGASSTQDALQFSGNCSERISRGGAWVVIPKYVRAAFRISGPASYRGHATGFRVARSD